MPWTPEQFKERHNKSLTKKEAEQAASIANNVLKSGGTDADAVRTANSVIAKNRRARKAKRKNG